MLLHRPALHHERDIFEQSHVAGRVPRHRDEIGEPAWSTSQHLCGSARMGTDDDDLAVVDERCRVRGVERLSVIDGSVLPAITSRGPHATIVMLAHRAAEFVGS